MGPRGTTPGDLVGRVRASLAGLRPAPGDAWVVACSGGPDSLVLLAVTAELRAELGVRLEAVYVDHGLRLEAAAEAELVARAAAALGVPARAVRVDVAGRAARERRSLMEAARLERYAALEAVADEIGATRILLGHTADDQVETVVMRLGRGTGVRGLAGMAAVRGRLARPLLDVTRAEVEELVRRRGLQPVRDPSNADRRFLRPVVRHDVLPALRERLPAIDRDLLALAGAARAFTTALDASLDAAAATSGAPDDGALDVAVLLADRPEVLRARLERAARRAGGEGLCAGHVAAIASLLRSVRGTRGVDLPGGLRAERRYGRLRFVRPGAAPAVACELEIPGPGRFEHLGHELVIERCTVSGAGGSNPHEDDPRWTGFDLDALVPPLVLRLARDGDRLRPRGFGHRRKVSDLLGEARVPAPDRRSVVVLADSREVLLVPGVRPSEAGRPVPSTVRGVRVRLARTGSSRGV